MITWRKMLIEELEANGETFENVISITLTGEELDMSFDNGYGGTEGRPFTAWTEKRVYFPVCYDGAEWVGSVSRNPDCNPTRHFGG